MVGLSVELGLCLGGRQGASSQDFSFEGLIVGGLGWRVHVVGKPTLVSSCGASQKGSGREMAAAEQGFFSSSRSCMLTWRLWTSFYVPACCWIFVFSRCCSMVSMTGVGWACAHAHILHDCGYSRLRWVEHEAGVWKKVLFYFRMWENGEGEGVRN